MMGRNIKIILSLFLIVLMREINYRISMNVGEKFIDYQKGCLFNGLLSNFNLFKRLYFRILNIKKNIMNEFGYSSGYLCLYSY